MQNPCSVFSLSFWQTPKFFSQFSVMEDENQRFSRMLNARLDKVEKQVKRFMEAAYEGDIKAFKKMARKLDRGKGLAATVASVKDGKERGALKFAAQEGKLEFCKYLVEELKIDVSDRDKEGETPVVYAARQGHTATVQYLIEKGEDPAIPSNAGQLCMLLQEMGVDVDLQTDGGTPLMCAASLGQEDGVMVLLEHHANPNALTGDDNMCPLALAVTANSLPCVELLVKAGANVNVKTGEASRYGETTPLLIAAYRGIAEIINCLLQAGADPNVADEDGNKPIHVAASRGSRAAVEALLAVTPRIQSVPEWSVDGVIEFMQSEYRIEQESTEAVRKANVRCLLTRLDLNQREPTIPKKDLPEVSPEAKRKAADAKANRKAADAKVRGDAAFKRNDFPRAVDCYRQAFEFDPTDGILFSNRSLCWLRLRQGEAALFDAKACIELKPDWAKAYHRKGAALRLLQRFEEAASAFYRTIQLDPECKELETALREAIEAARVFYGKKQE